MRAAACLTTGTAGDCFASLRFTAGCHRDCFFVEPSGVVLCLVGDGMAFLRMVVVVVGGGVHANPCLDRYASNISVADIWGLIYCVRAVECVYLQYKMVYIIVLFCDCLGITLSCSDRLQI